MAGGERGPVERVRVRRGRGDLRGGVRPVVAGGTGLMPVGDQRPVVPRRRHRPRRRVRRRAGVRVPERLVRGEAEVVQHPRIGSLQDRDRVPHLRRSLRDISGPGRGSQRLPHPRPLIDDRREVRERVVLGHLIRVVGRAGQVVQLAEVVVDAGGLEPQHRRHFRLTLHHRRLKPGRGLRVAVGQARVSLERVREGPVRFPVRRDRSPCGGDRTGR